MKDAIKTLYEHWINVHTTTPAEKSAFEVINEAAKGQAEHDPLYAAIVDYSEVIQYEAFKEGVLTALSLLHPLPEQGDKEYGLSDEELKALGEKTVASGKNLLLGGKSEPKQEPQEMWDGDFDFLMDFWF
jgi:hypothetical protein